MFTVHTECQSPPHHKPVSNRAKRFQFTREKCELTMEEEPFPNGSSEWMKTKNSPHAKLHPPFPKMGGQGCALSLICIFTKKSWSTKSNFHSTSCREIILLYHFFEFYSKFYRLSYISSNRMALFMIKKYLVIFSILTHTKGCSGVALSVLYRKGFGKLII